MTNHASSFTCSSYSGKPVRAKADHYARLRKRLQQKGTRSATRRLVVIAGRERRLKQARNHQISRRIVDSHPHSLIGLEDLTHIRERTKRKRGKKASKKQRRANRHASSWAFAELHSYLAYKGDLATEGLHIPAVTMANRLLKLFETLIHVQDEMKYNQKR